MYQVNLKYFLFVSTSLDSYFCTSIGINPDGLIFAPLSVLILMVHTFLEFTIFDSNNKLNNLLT